MACSRCPINDPAKWPRTACPVVCPFMKAESDSRITRFDVMYWSALSAVFLIGCLVIYLLDEWS